jgi:hypothetical protein
MLTRACVLVLYLKINTYLKYTYLKNEFIYNIVLKKILFKKSYKKLRIKN